MSPKRLTSKHGNEQRDQNLPNKRLNAREQLRRRRGRLDPIVSERREGDRAEVAVPGDIGLFTADHDPTDNRVDHREDGDDRD